MLVGKFLFKTADGRIYLTMLEAINDQGHQD